MEEIKNCKCKCQERKKLTLPFVNKSPNKNPEYSDLGSSGMDLRAWIGKESGEYNEYAKEYYITLEPLERKMVHTGIYFEIPRGYEIQTRPRSGMAIKQGLTLVNTPGTIDNSYTGECCLLVINLSNERIMITNGDRIAQAVLCPVCDGYSVQPTQIEKIEKVTERNDGGFGHTGVK